MAYERYVVSCVHGARLLNSLGWLIVCVWMVGIGWKKSYAALKSSHSKCSPNMKLRGRPLMAFASRMLGKARIIKK